MASLISLLAASTAPTGSRVMPDLTPSETEQIVRDGPAPLFEEAATGVRAAIGDYVEAPVPFWQSTTFLIILAVVAICLLIVLIVLVYKKRSEYRNINRRMQQESAYMRSSLFDAASDITRVSAMHNLKEQKRR